MALLQIDRGLGQRSFVNQVGLANQKSRNLDHVDDFGCVFRLRDFVNIGENRNPHFALYPRENFEAFLQTGTAKGIVTGAIRLIEGAFEDVWETSAARDFRDPARMAEA